MITPSIFLWGTISFLIALMVHILIWRFKKPPREMMWLVVIFILLPGIIYFGIVLSSLFSSSRQSCFAHPDIINRILTFIWHSALSSAYIMTYPPIQAGCPSLKIMLAIYSSRTAGMTIKDIERIFPEDTLFSDRFDDLIEDGLISWKYDAWGITGTGRLLARIFLTYRRLLKLPIGEG
jgi:hypothetical protein